MPAKKKTTKKAQPSPIPDILHAEAKVHSIGGISLFENKEPVTAENVEHYHSMPGLETEAVRKLRKAGFTVHRVSETSISISGPKKTYEKVFKTRIVARQRRRFDEEQGEVDEVYYDSTQRGLPGLINTSKSPLADVLEGVALAAPPDLYQSDFPPQVNYWHLDVPADVSAGLNADRIHRFGHTGFGIEVAMVDTGFFDHPYFFRRGYRVTAELGPGATDVDRDDNGHGTGLCANLLAAAPDANVTMVKFGQNINGTFNQATAPGPAVCSNAWGYDVRNRNPQSTANPSGWIALYNTLEASVAAAVRNGIVVVFAAGNGAFAFPGQHPDVISVGGAFMEANGAIQAATHASGYASPIYAGRNVPDVCGLVGMQPRGLYIMLPVQPDSIYDRTRATGGPHPQSDETATNDGWAAFSGTSSASAQISGVCAVLRGIVRNLTPERVRGLLMQNARDVTQGRAHARTGGNPATPGPDLATGAGLVDTHMSAMIAWLTTFRP